MGNTFWQNWYHEVQQSFELEILSIWNSGKSQKKSSKTNNFKK